MSQPQILAFIGGLGTSELMVILLIILVLFGAKKLPELARGLGKSVKEFKKATQEAEEDFREAMENVEPKQPVSSAPPPPKEILKN